MMMSEEGEVATSKAISQSTSTSHTYQQDLWDKYTELIDRLVLAKANVKQLQATFKAIHETQDKLGKSFAKYKITEKDMGTLADPMLKLNSFFTSFGMKNSQIAQDVNNNLYKDVTALRKDLSKNIKEANKEEKKLRSELSAAQNAAKSAKTKDHDEKKSFEKLQNQLISAKELPPKKLQALQKQVHEAEKSSKAAETAYSVAIQKLHETDKKYYEKLGELMAKLEELDRKRLYSVKSIMERFLFLQQDFSKILAQNCESMKTSFEKIDAEGDIQSFISATMSGQRPPKPMTFEPVQVEIPSELSNERFSVNFGNLSRSSSLTPTKPAGNFNAEETIKVSTATPVPVSNITPAVILPPAPVAAVAAVNSSKVLKRMKAVYDYAPENAEEMSLSVGDVVEVHEINEDGWWLGSCQGRKGYFPSNFTQEITAASEPLKPVSVPEPAPQQHTETTVALYDYVAQDEAEVSFSAGDMISIIQKHEDGWWYGLVNGKSGLFPSNYTQSGAS